MYKLHGTLKIKIFFRVSFQLSLALQKSDDIQMLVGYGLKHCHTKVIVFLSRNDFTQYTFGSTPVAGVTLGFR